MRTQYELSTASGQGLGYGRGDEGVQTLAILASKGGTGKTTVALHLACAAHLAGKRTLVADLDPQQSARDWKRERGPRAPDVTESRLGALFTLREDARRSGVDLLAIDTRPSTDADTLEAVRLADLCLIVVRPSVVDMRAITRTVEMVARQNKRAIMVVNQAPPRRAGHESPGMMAAVVTLRDLGPSLASVGLRSRNVYQQALALGVAAQELEPEGNAAAEIRALWRLVERELWPSHPVDVVRFPAPRLGLAGPPPMQDSREIRPAG